MDVVLLQDRAPLGAAGAVVHVKPGFARNYLIPQGLAAAATPQQLKAVAAIKRQQAQRRQRLHAEAEALKRQLASRSLTLKLTIGEQGQPFGSVTAHDLAEALAHEGLAVEKSMIQLEQPIKSLGVYDIPVRLDAAVTATLKVWVVKA